MSEDLGSAVETTPAPRKRQKPKPRPAPFYCDNHPDREATFHTTLGGAVRLIHFCDPCVPKHWR